MKRRGLFLAVVMLLLAWSGISPLVKSASLREETTSKGGDSRCAQQAIKNYTGDGPETGVGSFTRARQSEKPLTFIVYGDTRTRHDIHAKIIKRIVQAAPDFLIHTGDLVSDGTRQEDWDTFFRVSGDLVRSVPFFPTLGNHERDSELYFRYFTLPGNERYYSFDKGGIHFVALDSNDPRPPSGVSREDPAHQRRIEEFWKAQTDWLIQDLKAHQNADFICLFFHHPPFTAATRRKESAEKIRQRLVPIFEQYGVDVVFNGHDHNYQHHLVNGIHYVVTGGGGAPLYEVDGPIKGVTIKAVKVENFVRVVCSKGRLTLTAIDINGKVIERFEVVQRSRARLRAKTVSLSPWARALVLPLTGDARFDRIATDRSTLHGRGDGALAWPIPSSSPGSSYRDHVPFLDSEIDFARQNCLSVS